MVPVDAIGVELQANFTYLAEYTRWRIYDRLIL